MSSSLLITLEIGLVLGSLIALAVWELVSLRRYRRRRQMEQEAEARSKETGGPAPAPPSSTGN